MDPTRREQLGELLEQALARSREGRAELLRAVGETDAELHDELASLLASHDAAPGFLEVLAREVLPEALDDSAWPVVDDSLTGRTISHYEVLERLGGGGMGVVYKARDLTLGRLVALKFLPPHLSADPVARARLQTEARAASALDHPNIAIVHEVGWAEPAHQNGAGLFVAMAYYAGETIKQKIDRGPLPIAEVVGYAQQVADGLARAHESGIVHRDLKPANVIVTDRGQVKILDFGLAKLAGADLTREGTTPGTIAYMSPEQTRGARVDPRTDVWALGVVLYEMLAGVRPFRAEDDAMLVQAIRQDTPEPLRRARPAVTRQLQAIVDRCLRKEPANRYPSADALAADLRTLGGRPAARWWLGVGPVKRRGRIVLATALGLVVVATVARRLHRSMPGRIVVPPSKILVLPFVPDRADPSLLRLGRDLAITLSGVLDGIGGIRTVDALTVLAHAPPSGAPFTEEQAAGLARQLGAGTVLQGSVIGTGASVRVDATLVDVHRRDPLARATTAAPPDSITPLTDSLALGLLHQLWRGGKPPIASLSAVTTRSVSALRAYLEGEQALARGDFARAVEAFDRAFAADSSFWFAYWRSLYPRLYEGSSADNRKLAAVMRHKDELPERERLLVEAAQAGTITAQREALRGLLERFPDYWPGAWDYANLLVHWAPYLGSSYDEARTALENVVTLNPRFASAWQHLFWLAASQRDSGRAGVALDSMARLVDPGDMHWAFDLTYFRALNDAVHTGGVVSAEHERQMIQMVRTLAARVPQASWALTGSFTEFGFPAFQIRLNRRVLQSGPARQHAADLHLGTAMAWAARGAWDSAAVDLDEAVRLTTDLRDLLRAYGLSVMGVFLGGWNTDRAVARGAAATRVFALGPSDDRAELAWLDGLLCYARSDRAGLVRARARLQRSRSSETLLLDRSLRGFERMLQGDRAGAARTLERLEFDAGEQGAVGRYGAAHPYLSALDRLEASRWLLAVGDTMAAARLLTWYEATIPGDAYRADLPNRVAEPFALLERARIEVAQGRGDAAAFHYRLLAAVYDLPSSSQGSAMVAEALGALRRLPQARR